MKKSLIKNKGIKYLGILGSIASIIGLLLFLSPIKKSKNDINQLTVFVTDMEGNVVLENEGELNIPLGNRSLNSSIGENGRTNFADITSDNLNDTIRIGLKAEGWKLAGNKNTFIFNGKPIKS